MMRTYHFSTPQIIIASALIIALGLWLIAQLSSHFSSRPNAANISPKALMLMVQRGEELTGQSATTLAEASVLLSKSGAQVDQLAQQEAKPLWSKMAYNAGLPSIPLSERVSDYQMVVLSDQPTHFPATGDRVTLPLLADEQVQVQVEQAVLNANGDYTWRGHIAGQGTDYPVIMTYGAQGVFATITTPKGSYSLETLQGMGWLYKNPAEAELSHAGKNDYAEPTPPQP